MSIHLILPDIVRIGRVIRLLAYAHEQKDLGLDNSYFGRCLSDMAIAKLVGQKLGRIRPDESYAQSDSKLKLRAG